MTAMQRQRLNDYMQRLAYRERMAKRILVSLALAGLAFFAAICLTSCRTAGNSEFPKLTESQNEAFQLLNQ